jgi:hypothetical protein
LRLVSEYTGRRRGRPEPEPEPDGYQGPYEPEVPPQPFYGDSGYYETEYHSEPELAYRTPEPDYPSDEYGYAGYDYDRGYEPGYADNPADYPAPDSGYRDDDFGYSNDPAPELDYAEPRFEPLRRRNRGADPSSDFEEPRRTARGRPTTVGPMNAVQINLVPPIAVATIALAVASFTVPQAVAVVAAVLQFATAWAIISLLSYPNVRAVVIAALPALAADAGAFAYSPDISATATAAAIGCGFVLAAADTVLRTARRGVEPGASRELAAAVVALLVTCTSTLYVPAARLDHYTVLGGAILAGLLAFARVRRPDSAITSRAEAVGLPFAVAALASYAAAILVS